MAVLHHIPEGFQTYGQSTIAYMDSEDNLHMNVSAPVVMISAEAKLTTLAAMPECVPGTIAFLPGWTDAWQRTESDTWEQFISSGE